nr:MAG TPA: hypothetical protein [Caudoviricetes sp.]
MRIRGFFYIVKRASEILMVMKTYGWLKTRMDSRSRNFEAVLLHV